MIPFWLVLLGALGFGISYYISYKKSTDEPLVCVIGMDCNKVVQSAYSTFFGIPNEVLGMMYYAFLMLSFFAFEGGLVSLFGFPFPFIVFMATFGGLLMSVVLTYIQAFTIKTWCSWCLTSAAVNVVAFVVAWRAVF